MPHLQFEFNRSLMDNQKQTFAEEVRTLFSEVMATGTDHISISIREFGTYNLPSVGSRNLKRVLRWSMRISAKGERWRNAEPSPWGSWTLSTNRLTSR